MAYVRSTSEPTMEEESGICKLCHKSAAKYTCPRCNIKYCCSQCYKSEAHAQCSESFYRDCFMEGLQDMKTGGEDRQKVLEVLQRLEQENPVLNLDNDSDDDEEDLVDRLEGIDLDKDTDQVWKKLTDKERKEFQCMLGDGRLGNMIDLWQPWWDTKAELVQELGEDSPSTSQHPQILTSIQEFSKMMPRGAPSVTVKFNLVNVLYGYAYIMRLHNGEVFDVAVQAASGILQLSDALQQGNHDDTQAALHSVLQSVNDTIQTSSLFVSQEFSVAVLQDLVLILSGPGPSNPLLFTMSALSDLHKLFKMAKKLTDKELKQKESPLTAEMQEKLQEDKRQFFAVQKKLEFFLSWTHKFGLCLQCVVPEVELEFCCLSTELTSHKEDQHQLEKAWGGKRPPKMHRFIEEIADR